MVITRLGAGVDRERMLDADAIERTLRVLRDYRASIDRHDVARVRAVATSAVRDAANGDEFLTAAGDVLGHAPELLSGTEEGRASFRGATAALPTPALDPPGAGDSDILVVDIGGGSTELVLGRPDSPDDARVVSVDVGCVRVTERYLGSDPPTGAELAAASEAVDYLIDQAAGSLRGGDGPAERARPGRMIGLAGTVSAAAVLDQGLEEYRYEAVHHHVLGLDRIRDLLARLARLDHAARLGVPGLEPARADVIVGGLVVLVAVMEHFGFERCLASEADILDGLVQGLLAGT